ncbi:ATP-binding protein [Treponema sp.]|uniref:ATP-binding protein n=1 Tax=Treponema sp. TaxID=166 RepID=UPI00298EB95E|nr:AAA family ATPase [Treponema sp.]
MEYKLRRKIDDFLINWKNNPDRMPLIIKGARQIGKTSSIEHFAQNYKNFVEINFIDEPQYTKIFSSGYSPENVIKEISLINPAFKFIPNDTLILFDEMQACPDCATCLKFFKIDGRYDVICSGSLLGVNYNEITSVSVGYKEDYEMHSLDFEEFLWAKGYSKEQVESIYSHIKNLEPFSENEFDVWMNCFREYMITGGMPRVVNKFVEQNNFSGILQEQVQIQKAYEEDILKYAKGLDKSKIKNVYTHIPVFLAKENKRYQISKVAAGARNREYIGTVDWLKDAGIVNVCYNLDLPELPLKGNYNPAEYKIYYRDTGLLIASLDEEAQIDLRQNRNFNAYKGAIYENIVGDMLVKQGYELFYYRNEKATIEMDFFIRDADSLVPVEVKANNNTTASLKNLIEKDKYADIHYGIKLCANNVGFNGNFYTFPYFCTFLLKRYMLEKISSKEKEKL